jgi:hypothetical protein
MSCMCFDFWSNHIVLQEIEGMVEEEEGLISFVQLKIL